MMGYIFTATLIVGFVGSLMFTGFKALDDEDWRWLIPFAVLLVIMIALIIKGLSEEEAQGPCVKYDTRYSYNSATKTNMPYRVCAERGEWIK